MDGLEKYLALRDKDFVVLVFRLMSAELSDKSLWDIVAGVESICIKLFLALYDVSHGVSYTYKEVVNSDFPFILEH